MKPQFYLRTFLLIALSIGYVNASGKKAKVSGNTDVAAPEDGADEVSKELAAGEAGELAKEDIKVSIAEGTFDQPVKIKAKGNDSVGSEFNEASLGGIVLEVKDLDGKLTPDGAAAKPISVSFFLFIFLSALFRNSSIFFLYD